MKTQVIERLISLHGGITATAREIGISRKTIYRWRDRGVQPYLIKFIKAYIDQETARRFTPPPTEHAN